MAIAREAGVNWTLADFDRLGGRVPHLGQHLAHAGTADRAFGANHDDIACLASPPGNG
jgi:hypothetical protein